MTPIDPAFLLLPIFLSVQPEDGTPGSFRPADDIFEEAAAKFTTKTSQKDPSATTSTEDILRFTSFSCTKAALRRVCDAKDITPEITVFRFSIPKTVDYLRTKVTRLCTVQMIETSRSLVRMLAKDGLMEDGKEALLELGRIKAACDLLSQYVPQSILASLLASYNFTPLDTYLKSMQDEEAALLAATTSTKTKSKAKAVKANAESKELKRKPSKASQGVEKLKKVNVNGMAKLSSFFTAKTT